MATNGTNNENNKSNDEKNNNARTATEAQGFVIGKRIDWQKVRAEVLAEQLDLAAYTLPRTSLLVAVGTGAKLVAQKPEGMSTRVDAAHARMAEAVAATTAYRAEEVGSATGEVAAPRHEALRAYTWIARDLTDIQALEMEGWEGARAVQREVFGGVEPLRNLHGMQFWAELEVVRVRLEDPERRARLEAHARPALVAKMLAAQARLGEALGVKSPHALPTMLDAATMVGFLRRRMTAYLVEVLATANDSGEHRQKATAALKPVLELRKLQRTIRGAAAATEETDEEDDVIEDVDTEPLAEDDADSPLAREVPTTPE